MPKYASETFVTVDRTRAEIERTLIRYGASAFLYAWEDQRAVIGFRIADRSIRMTLPLPSRDEFRFGTRANQSYSWEVERTKVEQERAYDKATRQRWRALLLVIKAKLEAVDAGISTLESEFLRDIVLPSGETVGEWTAPQIEAAYLTGGMPKLLPSGTR